MFASLVPPFMNCNLGLLDLQYKSSGDERKHFIKQSYISLTWFYYFLNIKVDKKVLDKKSKKKNIFKLVILPKKRKFYTLPKAPMAMKDNSKEQFMFEIYYFKVTYTGNLKLKKEINSFNAILIFFNLLGKNDLIFGTNLLMLKYYYILATFSDSNFFDYNRFTNNKLN